MAFFERPVVVATGNNANISGYMLASYAEEYVCIYALFFFSSD